MSNYKITVWTPTYNRDSTIERCILSVINQSIKPHEYLILDDCSTDNTLSIANYYSSKYNWIKVYPNKVNEGPYANINRILNLASGDFLYGIGDDDYTSLQTLEKFHHALKRWPNTRLISGEIQVIDTENKDICIESVRNWKDIDYHNSTDCLNNYFLKEPSNHSLSTSSLISLNVLKELGGYNKELGHWCDTFVNRYIAFSSGMVYIPEVLHFWTSAHNTLSGMTRNNPKEYLDVINNSSRLMRSEQFRDTFPEEYVKYWEAGCRHYIIEPILGSYEYLLLQRNLKFFDTLKEKNIENKITGFLFKLFLKLEDILFTRKIRNKYIFFKNYKSLN